MILPDTNPLIWLHPDHRRARCLQSMLGSLYASPAALLEVRMLADLGRIRLARGARVRDLVEDDRWVLDDPPAADWFEHALGGGWTRDPFDRLLVAHRQLRGWRPSTGDGEILRRLGSDQTFEL